jgi:hypothetical protein
MVVKTISGISTN